MTRVSENMIFRSMSDGVGKAQERLLAAQQRATSGLRVEKPSDDPIAASRATVLSASVEQLHGMGRASGRAALEAAGADGALNQAEIYLQRAREIAVYGAAGPLQASDRAVMADEVAQLRAAMLGVANSEVGGVYLFGGFRTGTQPFAATGVYSGDTGTREVEVMPGVTVPYTVPGSEAFTAAGGEDIFGLLADLETALRADNPPGVQATLNRFEVGQTQLASARSAIGVAEEAFSLADTQRAEVTEQLAISKADAIEVDSVQSYLDLVEAQRAVQAAIAEATRILSGLDSGLSR